MGSAFLVKDRKILGGGKPVVLGDGFLLWETNFLPKERVFFQNPGFLGFVKK